MDKTKHDNYKEYAMDLMNENVDKLCDLTDAVDENMVGATDEDLRTLLLIDISETLRSIERKLYQK